MGDSASLVADDLGRSLHYIRHFFVSHVVACLLETNFFRLVREQASIEAIAADCDFDVSVLSAVLWFLEVEGLIESHHGSFRLTRDGLAVERCAGWFIELVGGYGPTMHRLERTLHEGVPRTEDRDGRRVALGSGLIDEHDVIPLAKQLVLEGALRPKNILDLGCGAGNLLLGLCGEFPDSSGVGVEANPASCELAQRYRDLQGLKDRVQFACCNVAEYTIDPIPDLILLAFVLHEVVYQRGIQGAQTFLSRLKAQCPGARILVFEVDHAPEDFHTLRSPVGGYYSCYYLIHRITQQRLLTRVELERLFNNSGFEVKVRASVCKDLDPTGLGLGYLLDPTHAST